MDVLITVSTWICLAGGAFFAVTGGVGVMRLPDVFTRLHASGMTDTMGAGLILAGLMLHAGLTLVTVKLVFILLFLWMTSPISTHAVARAALAAGLKPVSWRPR